MTTLLNITIFISTLLAIFLAFRHRMRAPILLTTIACITPGIAIALYLTSWIFKVDGQSLWFDSWIGLFFMVPINLLSMLTVWLLPPYQERGAAAWTLPLVSFAMSLFAFSILIIYMPNP